MPARPALAAAHREVTGKAVARLRRDGRLPAVVFGHGVESVSVSLDAHEFDQLRRHIGANALIDVSIDGQRARPALVHGVQVDLLKRHPIHVDLLLVRMTEELIVDVPIVPVGRSDAVDTHGGTFLQVLDSIRVRALPDRLPQSIELRIDSLVDFDAVLKVADLSVPSEVTLLTDTDEVVAKVVPPRVEAEPEVAPTEAPEGPVEGGEPAAAGAEEETAEA
jgi:large subunit ribosomal protein L25